MTNFWSNDYYSTLIYFFLRVCVSGCVCARIFFHVALFFRTEKLYAAQQFKVDVILISVGFSHIVENSKQELFKKKKKDFEYEFD